jgi:hypothetical protein
MPYSKIHNQNYTSYKDQFGNRQFVFEDGVVYNEGEIEKMTFVNKHFPDSPIAKAVHLVKKMLDAEVIDLKYTPYV